VPIIDLIHDAGGCIHVHCHARVKQVLPDFVEMGVDVLHPFEAPPTASPYIRGMGEVCYPQYKAMVDTVLAWGRE